MKGHGCMKEMLKREQRKKETVRKRTCGRAGLTTDFGGADGNALASGAMAWQVTPGAENRAPTWRNLGRSDVKMSVVHQGS